MRSALRRFRGLKHRLEHRDDCIPEGRIPGPGCIPKGGIPGPGCIPPGPPRKARRLRKTETR